jgi:hypothetical protein
MVLSSTLQVRQLNHSLVDNVQGLLDLLLGDDKRWGETNNVLVGRLGLMVHAS